MIQQSHCWIYIQRSIYSLLGIYSKKMKSLSWEGICTLMFVATLFTVGKTWNNLIGSGWMGVENMDVYSHVNTTYTNTESSRFGVAQATHLLSWPCNKLFSAPNWRFILFNLTASGTRTCTNTERNIIQPLKRRDPIVYGNIDEPRGHYVKCNKPDM